MKNKSQIIYKNLNYILSKQDKLYWRIGTNIASYLNRISSFIGILDKINTNDYSKKFLKQLPSSRGTIIQFYSILYYFKILKNEEEFNDEFVELINKSIDKVSALKIYISDNLKENINFLLSFLESEYSFSNKVLESINQFDFKIKFISTFSILFSNFENFRSTFFMLTNDNNCNYDGTVYWSRGFWENFIVNKNELTEKINYFINDNQLNIDEQFVKSISNTIDIENAKTICSKELQQKINFNPDKDVHTKTMDIAGYLKFLFLENESSKIIVPVYQRNYVWNQRNISRLIWDIENKMTPTPNLSQKHFLSLIFLSERKEIGNDLTYSIIDGQQRTITIILIALAIYLNIGFINAQKNSDTNSKKEEILVPEEFAKIFAPKKFLTNKFFGFNGEEYFSQIEQCLISNDWSSLASQYKQFTLLAKFQYILQVIFKKFSSWDNNKIYQFIGSFLYNLMLSVVYFEPMYDYEYFKRINHYTVKLDELDLIKSDFHEVFISLFIKKKNVDYIQYLKNKQWQENISNYVNDLNSKVLSSFRNSKNKIDNKKLKKFANFLCNVNDIDFENIVDVESSEDNTSYIVFNKILNNYISNEEIPTPQEIIDKFTYDLNIFDLLTCVSLDAYNSLVDKIVTNRNISEKLKLTFFHVSMTIKGLNNTIYIQLVYEILRKFELFNDAQDNRLNNKKFNECLNWIFEIQRFNFIWKTILFKGDSLARILDQIAFEIRDNKIDNINEFRNKLYSIYIFKQFDLDFKKLNENLELQLLKNQKEKYYYKLQNNEKLNYLLFINWFILNNCEQYIEESNDKYIGEILKIQFNILDGSSLEHFESVMNKDSNSKFQDEIESLGNAMILKKPINSQNSNKNIKNKTATLKSVPSSNHTYFGLHQSDILEKIKVFEDWNEIYYNTDELLMDLSTFQINNKENTPDEVIKREKQLLTLLYNMFMFK